VILFMDNTGDMMNYRKMTENDAETVLVLLRNSGRLIQFKACYDPCEKLNMLEMEKLLRNPLFDFGNTMLAEKGGDIVGCLVWFVKGEEEKRFVGLTLFHIEDQYLAEAGQHFINALLKVAKEEKAATLIQSRMPTTPEDLVNLSTIFTLTTDKRQIDLFLMNGFSCDRVAGNMIRELTNYEITPEIIAREEELKSKLGVVISTATKDEVRRLVNNETLVSYGSPFIDPERPKAVVVAKNEKNLIGYSTYFHYSLDWDVPEYGPVKVCDDYRQHGIAKAMLFRSLEFAKSIGKKRVRLSCADGDIPRFYVYYKTGFVMDVELWFQNLKRVVR